MPRPARSLTHRLVVLLASLLISSACSTEPDSEPVSQTDSENELVKNRGEGKDLWWHEQPRASWSAFDKISTSQDWFEVYRIRDGVFALYEPGQFEEIISYLIVGTQRALLFDTGLGIGDIKQLATELTDLEIVVVNSHSHYDHIGGNHAFDQVYSPQTDFTVERSAGLSHDQVKEFVGPGWIWKDTPKGFSAEAYQTHQFRISRFLTDGEQLDLGDRTLEVLLTPGHAPDALCLLDRANGLLFTGDTFYLAPLYTHLEGSSFELYLETARRLATLASEVEILMPGHNETGISGSYLLKMRDAFESIAAGAEPDTISDGHREFHFDGFKILTN